MVRTVPSSLLPDGADTPITGGNDRRHIENANTDQGARFITQPTQIVATPRNNTETNIKSAMDFDALAHTSRDSIAEGNCASKNDHSNSPIAQNAQLHNSPVIISQSQAKATVPPFNPYSKPSKSVSGHKRTSQSLDADASKDSSFFASMMATHFPNAPPTKRACDGSNNEEQLPTPAPPTPTDLHNSTPFSRDIGTIVRRCINDCWGYDSPRPFQVEAIIDLAVRKRDLFMIRKTGEGKSIVPLTVAALLRHITIVLVPLIGLGSDQVNQASCLRRRIEAYHLDENKQQDFDALVLRLKRMIQDPTHAKNHSVVLYVSPSSLKKESRWNGLFRQMATRGVIKLFTIDEAHTVVTDGREFRKEFQEGVKHFLSILSKSPTAVPKLAMTATLRLNHQAQLKNLLNITSLKTIWGNMDRRSISINVRVDATATKAMTAKLIQQYNTNPGTKRLLYSNSAAAAEGILKTVAETVLFACKILGDVIALTGIAGVMMKTWLMYCFCCEDLQHQPSLTIFPVTATANCGVNCRKCSGADSYGPPPSIYELFQQLGRADRKNDGLPGENDYTVFMSLKLYINLLLRVWKTENKEEREILERDLHEVLEFLVLPTDCYHKTLEEKLEDPTITRVREPCRTACSFCNHDNLTFTDFFSKKNLIKILRNDVFFEGSTPIMNVLKILGSRESKERIYGRGFSTKNQGKLHGIVLQLIASKIIVLKCSDNNLMGTRKLTKHNIVANFGKYITEDGDNELIYTKTSAWLPLNVDHN
jgi:superfamily II DNA helicase RecQ